MLRIRITMICISCALSFLLSAQEYYNLKQVSFPPQPGELYTCHKVNLYTGQIDSLFSIDPERFDTDDPDIFTRELFISSFEFNRDKSQVYLLDERGSLYRYTISTDVLELVDDVLSGDMIWVGPNYYSSLFFLDDSTLYVKARTIGIYHLNTGTFDTIVPYTGGLTIDSDFIKGIPSQIIKHKDRYYASFFTLRDNRQYNLTLFEYDLYDLENKTRLLDIDVFANSLMDHTYSCDSTVVLGYNFQEKKYYHIDIEKKEIKLWNCKHVRPKNSTAFDMQKSYPSYTWPECQRAVDLDDDDGTAPYLDFYLDNICTPRDIPICDTDVLVRNPFTLDSIELIMDNFTLQLPLLPGTLSGKGESSGRYVIYTNGSAQNTDYENALRSLLGDVTLGVEHASVTLTPWYGGQAGPPAQFLLTLDDVPYAGVDTSFTICPETSFNLDSIYVYRSDTIGTIYNDSYNAIDQLPDVSVTKNTLLYYIASNEHCADTSEINVLLTDSPTIQPIEDKTTCPGELVDITIMTEDEIMWNDMSTDKNRTISINDTTLISYTLTNTSGCTSRDTFLIYPQVIAYDSTRYQLCSGDSMHINGKFYTQGFYQDTIQSMGGCDSLIQYRIFENYDEIPIVIDGEVTICTGDSTYINITSQHSDLKLDGNPKNKYFHLNSEGNYRLTGTDINQCYTEKEITITELPKPNIDAPSKVDTAFTQNLSLPVTYSGSNLTYVWSPSDNLSCDDCAMPEILAPIEGTYTVVATDANQCSSQRAITVTFADELLYTPSVISKNPVKDENGVFYVMGNSDITYQMKIFDRWGNMLHQNNQCEINNMDDGWIPSNNVTPGIYVFKISYIKQNKLITKLGTITIL